jgi:hypothetical protein
MQGEEIVADHALKPLHPIIAGHAKFAPMGEVNDADRFADGAIFREHISVVQRDLPVGDLVERGLQFVVVVVETGLFHGHL